MDANTLTWAYWLTAIAWTPIFWTHATRWWINSFTRQDRETIITAGAASTIFALAGATIWPITLTAWAAGHLALHLHNTP